MSIIHSWLLENNVVAKWSLFYKHQDLSIVLECYGYNLRKKNIFDVSPIEVSPSISSNFIVQVWNIVKVRYSLFCMFWQNDIFKKWRYFRKIRQTFNVKSLVCKCKYFEKSKGHSPNLFLPILDLWDFCRVYYYPILITNVRLKVSSYLW